MMAIVTALASIGVTVNATDCQILEPGHAEPKANAMKLNALLPHLVVTAICANAFAANEPLSSLARLREGGAFEFPQQQSKVLCDNPDLRLSVLNNEE